jgi:hypothetical protein
VRAGEQISLTLVRLCRACACLQPSVDNTPEVLAEDDSQCVRPSPSRVPPCGSPAERVFLLKLLCDDALETEAFRRHMEEALAAAEEETRQQRREVMAAREEVKEARAKLRELEVGTRRLAR